MDKRLAKAYDEVNIEQLKNEIVKNLYVSIDTKSKDDLIESFYKTVRIVDTFEIICVLIGMFFAVLGAEFNINFELEPDQTLDQVTITFNPFLTIVTSSLLIVSVTTIPLLICIIIRYSIILKMDTYNQYMLRLKDNLFTSGYYKYLLLELTLNLVHTPPYIDGSVSVGQSDSTYVPKINIDFILTILLLFCRSYQLFRYYLVYNKWFSYNFEKICKQCKTPMDFMFSLKVQFRENPFTLVILSMLISFFVFGYAVRSIEMFFMPQSPDPLDWRFFWNGIWCIIITMSTVGFGDFYPQSLIGRIITIFSSFLGTFLISLMVAALSVAVDFNSQEENAYQTIKSIHNDLQYGKAATTLLQCSLRYYWHGKSATETGVTELFKRKKSMLLQKLKKRITKFRKLRKSKNEALFTMLLDQSLSNIDQNISIELEKIKEKLPVLDELKIKIEDYHNNQKIIKDKINILFRELMELQDLKERFLNDYTIDN